MEANVISQHQTLFCENQLFVDIFVVNYAPNNFFM